MNVFPEFWMVLSDVHDGLQVDFTKQPTVRHKTESCAKKEAARLASKYPGIKFFVLKAVAACVKADVEWSTAEDLPF